MKIKKGTSAVANTAPIKTSLKVLFKITLFMDWNALKYSISLNCPITGFTALDQVKKIPDISPVNNMARIKIIISVLIKTTKYNLNISSKNLITFNKW